METDKNHAQLVKKLDDVQKSVQQLFILEAIKADIPVERIRDILRVNMNNISDISRHMKKKAAKK
jgi:hypothetical protein